MCAGTISSVKPSAAIGAALAGSGLPSIIQCVPPRVPIVTPTTPAVTITRTATPSVPSAMTPWRVSSGRVWGSACSGSLTAHRLLPADGRVLVWRPCGGPACSRWNVRALGAAPAYHRGTAHGSRDDAHDPGSRGRGEAPLALARVPRARGVLGADYRKRRRGAHADELRETRPGPARSRPCRTSPRRQ